MSIRFTELEHRFKSQVALDRVQLHVRSGDCYGFIGHNGAGKTTALRIALGLLRADRGHVSIAGLHAARNHRARALVGGLIERPGFHDGRTGWQNLRMLAAVQGIPKVTIDAHVQRVLDAVGLADAGKKKVGHYSQGMRQRLGLAQAMLGDPRYLILDEPTNGLDPEGIQQLRTLLRQLARDGGVTILLSSHLLHEVADLCNRIGVLREGQLLVEAPTEEFLATASNAYRLETDDNQAAAAHLAAHDPTVIDAGALHLTLSGVDPGEVVASLVGAGCKVLAFAPIETTLEEIYLSYTRGERTAPDATSRQTATDAPEPPTAIPRLGNPIGKIVRYELHRLRHPATILALSAPALIALLVIYQRSIGIHRDSAAIASGNLASATSATSFEALGRAIQTALPLLALIVACIASQSIAGEFARGTLRNLLIRPFHRFEIALGKLIGLTLATLCAYLGLLAAAASAAGIAFDYGDAVEYLSTGAGAFTVQPAKDMWPHVGPVLASPLLPLLAFTALGFLCGSLARGAASALALTLTAVIGLDLARAFARPFGVEEFLLGPYLPSPLAGGALVNQFVQFTTGVGNVSLEVTTASVWVPAVWMTVGGALAAVILLRKYVP